MVHETFGPREDVLESETNLVIPGACITMYCMHARKLGTA